MEKNQIFIKTGTKYKKMTRELLEESNLAELIGDKNKMVGIKPNLVSPSDPANGGNGIYLELLRQVSQNQTAWKRSLLSPI